MQAIRRSLDAAGFTNTAIMSYSTKFASSFYGPFREAAGTALKGDRKTYQMSPMNRREAIRESLLDEARGRRLPDGETGWRLPWIFCAISANAAICRSAPIRSAGSTR